jgi:hypothetical protein
VLALSTGVTPTGCTLNAHRIRIFSPRLSRRTLPVFNFPIFLLLLNNLSKILQQSRIKIWYRLLSPDLVFRSFPVCPYVENNSGDTLSLMSSLKIFLQYLQLITFLLTFLMLSYWVIFIIHKSIYVLYIHICMLLQYTVFLLIHLCSEAVLYEMFFWVFQHLFKLLCLLISNCDTARIKKNAKCFPIDCYRQIHILPAQNLYFKKCK